MRLTKQALNGLMEKYKVPGLGLSLIKNGEVTLAEGFGILEAETNNETDSDTLFNACSISKLATSLLALKLVSEEVLNLDKDVNQMLTSWKVPDSSFTSHKKVTIRTILSHQSGIIDPKGSFQNLSPTQGIPSIVDLLEGTTPYCTEPIAVKYEPESDFHYSDAGFCILEQLMEDVSGKPFKLLMHQLLFDALHMAHSTYEPNSFSKSRLRLASGHDKNRTIVAGKHPIYPYAAASGLWSTPKDLALLVLELIAGTNGRGHLGISEKLMQQMFTPQGSAKWTGLGLFLDKSGREIEISSLGWGVGFQCMLVAYPYLETGAVIMINKDAGIHQLQGIIGEVYRSLDFQ